jgi:ATP-dependent exoDNAse (exonuclease V) alpha subunit
VRQLSEGDAISVVAEIRSRDLLKVGRDRDVAAQQMVQDWFSNRKAQSLGQDLMIAATREDVGLVNRLARSLLIERGELGLSLRDAQNREWAMGDRILFTRNSRLHAVRNGQLGTVQDVRIGQYGLELKVRLDNGEIREIGEDYPHIDYGYAITVHKAQGVTVERAHVLLHESMSTKEWSYVAVSRAREQTKLYCEAGMYAELEKLMARGQEKETTLQYAVSVRTFAHERQKARDLESERD